MRSIVFTIACKLELFDIERASNEERETQRERERLFDFAFAEPSPGPSRGRGDMPHCGTAV